MRTYYLCPGKKILTVVGFCEDGCRGQPDAPEHQLQLNKLTRNVSEQLKVRDLTIDCMVYKGSKYNPLR